MQKLNWKQIKKNIKLIGLECRENTTHPMLNDLAKVYGYIPHSMTVSLDNLESVDSGEGIIVTHENEESNNGVYLFCLQSDGSTGLIVVIPSTVSKGPMIHKVVGDLTTVIDGVNTPALTTFDKVEIAGHVIANTILKPIVSALGLPKEKEQLFMNLYLPRFMANVAHQYLGSFSIKEETVDMEPQIVKQMILHPEAFNPSTSDDAQTLSASINEQAQE